MWAFAFFVLPLAGLAYVGWHIYALLPIAPVWRWLIIVLGVVAFFSIFFDLTKAVDRMPLSVARAVYEVGTSAIFVLLYLVMIFLVIDLGRLCHVVPREWLYGNWITSLAVLGVTVAIFAYGNIHYRSKERVALDVQTQNGLDRNLKIVMLSDLHLGYHNPKDEFSRWVEMINAEQPDLVLFGGDIIDISVRPLLEEGVADEFHKINAPMFACFGNHEYYAGKEEARDFYRKADINLLCDSAAEAAGIVIVGRDDRSNGHRMTLHELMNGIDKSKFSIVLDHQPYHLEQSEREGADFQFSGHTHYGQVWPISWITDALYECAFGSWQRGETRYYVSSGMGIWGGKFRIGTRSEYVVLNVKE